MNESIQNDFRQATLSELSLQFSVYGHLRVLSPARDFCPISGLIQADCPVMAKGHDPAVESRSDANWLVRNSITFEI